LSEISGLIQTVSMRLSENKPVRRKLPVWGRVHIDRQLPFLCIYRKHTDTKDTGTIKLAQGEASHLLCSASRSLQPDLSRLTGVIARNLVKQFGSCLILEIWARPHETGNEMLSQDDLVPSFNVIGQGNSGIRISSIFQNALSNIKVSGNSAHVDARVSRHCCPEKLLPLLSHKEASDIGCHLLGIELSPIYLDNCTGEVYPDILRILNRQFTLVLQQALFKFTKTFTTHRPPHYHSLGRRALVNAVWEVDRILAEISESLELLVNITPVNARSIWSPFRRSGFDKVPHFHYRPLPVDPVILKRQLYKAPVTKLEDPALSQLFRERMEEMDRQINMLRDRDTPHFLPASIQVYGGVEEDLLRLAEDLMRIIPPRCREGSGKYVDAHGFAKMASNEIGKYQKSTPEFKPGVEIRDDIVGLMVSRGNLLINNRTRVYTSRANALIQHEIGTHALTYFNGRSQKFKQLYSGLAGNEAFQEGIAVLNEYLAGGLNRSRLRLLAARVIAVHKLLNGSGFVENFRELTGRYGLARRTAFGVLVRVHRGGGFTKDAIYLRGLADVLKYLSNGGDLDLLYVGKIAHKHIPIIRELQWRKVLNPPLMMPLFLEEPEVQNRLQKIRNGLTIIEMARRS